MPLAPSRIQLRTRLLKTVRRAAYFSGVNAYAVVSPFTVYGWSEITIVDWLFLVRPKANTSWSKTSMIGDPGVDYPSTGIVTHYPTNYSYWVIGWSTRRPDGTRGDYSYYTGAYINEWVYVVRRFTSAREISFWINGNKVYSRTVPSDEKTVLEWNPNTATYPDLYKRFVLGANVSFGEYMTMYQSMLLIYSRALSDAEIQQIYNYPYDPPRNGLVLWLDGDSLDCSAGKWWDKSGFGNHATLYNVACVDVIKKPARVLSPVR
jgi:hypothetical protein